MHAKFRNTWDTNKFFPPGYVLHDVVREFLGRGRMRPHMEKHMLVSTKRVVTTTAMVGGADKVPDTQFKIHRQYENAEVVICHPCCTRTPLQPARWKPAKLLDLAAPTPRMGIRIQWR